MAEKARTAQSPPSINDLINLDCCDFYRNGNNLSSPQPSTSPATTTGGGNSSSNITGQSSDNLSATPTTPIIAAPPPPPPPTTSTSSMQSSDLGTPERLTHPLAIHGAFLSMHNSISPRDHSSADTKLKQSTPKSPSAASTAGKLGVAGSLLIPITTTSPSSSSSTPSHTGSTATATTPAGLLALKVRDGTLGKGRHGGDDDDDDDATKGCDGPSVIVLKLRRDEKQRLRELVLQNEFVRNAAGLGERKLSGAFDAADDVYLRAFALLFLGHLARITRSVFDLGTQGFFEQKVLSPFVHCILVSVDESPADFPASLSASTTTVATPWSTSAAAATAAARASGLSSVPLSPVVAGAAAAAMMAHAGGAGGGGAVAAGSAMLLGPPRRKLSNFSVNADDAAVFAGSRRDSLRMRSNSIASPSYCSGTESCGIISSSISSIASSSITSPSTSSTSSTSSAALVTPATAVVAAVAAKEKKVKKKKSVTAEAEDAAQGGNKSGMYWSTPPTRRASPLQTAVPKSLEIPPLEQSVETTVEGLLVNKSAVVSLLLPRLCVSLERSLPPPAQLPAGVPSVLWKALELAARAVSRGCSDLLSAACDTRFLLCARRPKSASNPSSSSSSSSPPSESLLTASSSSSSSSPLSSTIIATAASSTTTATAQKRPRKGVLKSTNSTGSINTPVTSVSSQAQQSQPQQQQQQQASSSSSKHSPILPQLLPSNPSLSSPFTQSGGGGGGCSIPTTITITSPPSQPCPRSEETRSNSSSSSGSGNGNSGSGSSSILPPVSVRTLHWGNVFRDKSTGMYVYRSKLDKVQIGALPDTVKMCVERGADVPSAYILPARLFACGANWADFEFPVLFHLYVTRRVTRGELVRPTIIGSHAQIAQVRQALAEAVPTPPRAQLQADGGDICAALAPEFEYFSEGRVKDLDEYIQFCEFDEATGAVRVALPIRSCPERRGYLVIRKRGALLFFYEDGRLTGIVDSDAQHTPNPRAAEFYAQHAIPPPPGTSPAAAASAVAASTSSTSSSSSATASAAVPQLLLSSPPVAPGFVFTPPDFGVTFLGTSNGFDKNGRTSGFILWLRGRGIAVDPPHGAHAYLAGCAGGGSVLRMIDGIYLTHCHADHDSGLVQFLLAAQKRLPLYAADAVLCSERRKLAATLGCADPTVYYRPAPVPIGTPTKIGAGTFVFNYSFHSIPTVGFKVECCGKTLFYSADTKYDPALYADLEARGVLSPERARHLASWGFDADHIIHEMGAPPLHTSVAVLTKLPPEVKARMCVIHCASAPEGLHKPLEGLENTLRFKIPKSGDDNDGDSDSKARSELEAEAARLLSTTVPFLSSDPAAVEALAPLARKKTYSKGKKIAKTHSGLYIVAGGAVIRRSAEGGRVSPSPSPKLIDGNNANSGGGGNSGNSGNNSGKKKKKSSHHHQQQQQHSPAQASPSPLPSGGGGGGGSAVLYYGDYFGENTIANASVSHSPYAHTAACTPTVVIRVSAKALRKILPQRRLLVPCIQSAGVPTTTAITSVPNLLRVFEAQCGECTAEALLSPGERSLDRALAAVKGGGGNSNASIPWAICIVRKGAVLVRAAGREAAFRKAGAGAWFAPGRVAGMCAVEETALCLVDSAAFEKVVTESPYLLHYVKNSGVLL